MQVTIRTRHLLIATIMSLRSVTCLRNGDVIDMTHPFNSSTIYWPGMPAFDLTIIYRNITERGFWLEVNSFSAGEHGGTHIDAPSHMVQGGRRLHEVALQNLIGPGVMIDISNRTLLNWDELLSVVDIEQWELQYGTIPNRAILLINTGWSAKWRDVNAFLGTYNVTNSSTFHFPGIALDTALWLVRHRNVLAVGIDTPSVDGGRGSDQFIVHRALLVADIVTLENLNYGNLEKWPPNGFLMYAIPMDIFDGSGGPLRAFSIWDDALRFTNGASNSKNMQIVLLTLGIFIIVFNNLF